MQDMKMTQEPPDINIIRRPNAEWMKSLRWLNQAHYDHVLDERGLQGSYRVRLNGRFLCRLIPSALDTDLRQELFELSLCIAHHKVTSTLRLQLVGGGIRPLTKSGTPSVYARPRPLACLKHAKEGVVGFEGVGRGGGCCPCAFNERFPHEYGRFVECAQFLNGLYREKEPECFARQLELANTRPHLLIPGTVHSQGVSNFCFPMMAHRDRGNAKYSLSIQTNFGDYTDGFLIFPEAALAVSLRPGDALIFNGRALHGVGPFTGVRLSLVLYLRRDIFNCDEPA